MVKTNNKIDNINSERELGNQAFSSSTYTRKDLLKMFPLLKRIFKLRSFQFILILPNLLFFYLFIFAGVFGTPVGSSNLIIIFVWIVWWFLLIALMVPFFSRLWCIMCPIPFLGEWFQRRALVKVRPGKTAGLRNKMFGLNKRWPRQLSNLWIQNIGFMILGTFFIILATRPFVSAVVLGGLFILSAVLAVIYQRRTFCCYVCPVSGFLGIYSMSSTIELRAVEINSCVRCNTKSCALGNESGWSCPWFLYIGKLDRNNNCGLCMECLKACEYDNVSLFLRPPFSDIEMKGYDEVWKAFIMLALALVYSVVLLGPWGFIRDWANVTETGNLENFLIYTAIVWGVCLLFFPLVWAFAVYLSKIFSGTGTVKLKNLFVSYSYMLVPIGLAAWIAFSFPLLMVNGSYIISVLSDPLGRGWDLFGTAGFPWKPYYPEYAVYIQIVLFLIGLGYALKKGYDIGKKNYLDEKQTVLSLIPVGAFCVVVTIIFLKLFAG